MGTRFTSRSRKIGEDLIKLYGAHFDHLHEIISYPGQPKNRNKVVEFFLKARSSTEARAVDTVKVLVETDFGKVLFMGYEWVTFSLPGGNYKPDWSCLLEDGRWVRVEVKASKMQPGYKDARAKLRAAATLNPWDIFIEVRPVPLKNGGGWEVEIIKQDAEWLTMLIPNGGISHDSDD
jgi:hypothetical protein